MLAECHRKSTVPYKTQGRLQKYAVNLILNITSNPAAILHTYAYLICTEHYCLILVNNKLDAQFFSCMFISILYMFRAAMCPSPGELLYQCDTWLMSLCADDRLVCTFNLIQ